jgi:hypothetical protein
MIENLDGNFREERSGITVGTVVWLVASVGNTGIPSSQTLCTGQVVDSDCAPSSYCVDFQMIR